MYRRTNGSIKFLDRYTRYRQGLIGPRCKAQLFLPGRATIADHLPSPNLWITDKHRGNAKKGKIPSHTLGRGEQNDGKFPHADLVLGSAMHGPIVYKSEEGMVVCTYALRQLLYCIRDLYTDEKTRSKQLKARDAQMNIVFFRHLDILLDQLNIPLTAPSRIVG